jgi:pyridoxal phosphate enzyme (YggS family)
MPFLDLPERVREVRERIDGALRRGGHAQHVTVVAVTKTHGLDALQAAWNAGLQDVGENRVQEALEKMDALQPPLPFRWHLIGHLQRNKVKHLPRFHILHSLDRSSLADAVDREGRESGRVFDVFVQVNIVGEETKGGYSPETLPVEAERLKARSGLRVRGVMTMAPFGASESVLRTVFSGARRCRDVLRNAGHDASELSMGMSDDFEIAVEEGATCVRLGTVLFGAREQAGVA